MPNWWNTNIVFNGSEEDISDLFNKIKDCTSENFQENGFGATWLGNILHDFDDFDLAEIKLCCYRDSLTRMSNLFTKDKTAFFTISTETLWCPMIKMWQAIIEKHYGNRIKMHWIAEEPDSLLYLTDDASRWKDRYWVNCNFPHHTKYFVTAKSVVDFINSNFKEIDLPTSTDFKTLQTFEEDNKRITVIPLVEAADNEIY